VKYSQLTLGQIEALVNILGSMEGVKRIFNDFNNCHTCVFADHTHDTDIIIAVGNPRGSQILIPTCLSHLEKAIDRVRAIRDSNRTGPWRPKILVRCIGTGRDFVPFDLTRLEKE